MWGNASITYWGLACKWRVHECPVQIFISKVLLKFWYRSLFPSLHLSTYEYVIFFLVLCNRDKLVISWEYIIMTAWMTKSQRENSLWAAVRKLRITASTFGKVIGAIRGNRNSLISIYIEFLNHYNLYLNSFS